MGFTATGDFSMGMQFLGPKWSEPTLLGFAYDYEQETMHRQPPAGFDALRGEELIYDESMENEVGEADSATRR
jgi:amidase